MIMKWSYSRFWVVGGRRLHGSVDSDTCISWGKHHHKWGYRAILLCPELPHAIALQSCLLYVIALGSHKYVLCHCSFIILRCHINRIMESMMLWDGLLSLSIMPLRLRLFHELVACSFMLLSNIPFYRSGHLLKDIWVVSSLGQLWIKLLSTIVDTSLHS